MHPRIAMAVSAVLLGLSACTSVPIVNVERTPVVSASGKGLSTQDVRMAILKAGASQGWQMQDEGPGKIVATLNLRKHQAIVDIPYDSKTYSIVYRSSANLNEQDGQIHKNYNSWVQNLNRSINSMLIGQ